MPAPGVSVTLARAFNEQIGKEFGAGMQSGEKNLLMVEAYLVHLEKAH